MDRHLATIIGEAERRRALERKLRTPWLADAVEEWERRTGRPPTAADLRRTLRRFHHLGSE